MMKILLKYGVNINARGPENMTALHFCCKYGIVEAAAFLVENKADLNLKDEKECTALEQLFVFDLEPIDIVFNDIDKQLKSKKKSRSY